jgi:hypothetical protein
MYRGAPDYSLEGYFENSYNYAAVRQYPLGPLSPGGCRRYRAAAFDHVTDMPRRSVAHPDIPTAPSCIGQSCSAFGMLRSSDGWILPCPLHDALLVMAMRPIQPRFQTAGV